MRLRWTSNAFLGYLCNILYMAAAHIKALHILLYNLPVLTEQYAMTFDASVTATYTNYPRDIPIVCNRTNEEISSVLDLNAASAA